MIRHFLENLAHHYQWAYQHPFASPRPDAMPGPYSTQLSPSIESKFRDWVNRNNVNHDPDNPKENYDMRGYYLDNILNKKSDSGATISRSDQLPHYPDYYKTPYHPLFSDESKWAVPGMTPSWNEKGQLVSPLGHTIAYDDENENSLGVSWAPMPSVITQLTPTTYSQQ